MATASLLDVASAPRTVRINDLDVAVYGVSGKGLAAILGRFPDVAKMFSGIEPDKAVLMQMGPDVLAAFIAAGCGCPNDDKAEKVASDLSVGNQLELVDAIIKISFPRGISPFVAKLREFGLSVRQGAEKAEEEAASTVSEPLRKE